jgi:Putative Ig domain
MRRVADLAIVLVCAVGMASCQLGFAAGDDQAETQGANQAAQSDAGLVIENDSELPPTFPHGTYELQFRAQGGISALHWRLEKGTLPPGMKLEDNGLLHGQAEHTGEFRFTVSVTDGRPQQAVQKEFVLRVTSALTLLWKAPARVNGNRIEGSVEVSNTTPSDIDLTFIVLAVAENGRATAIGYQHFMLRRGTVAKELPFGETLPPGGYVVHVDTVGEVAAQKLIYRERLQTPSALQVTVGP